MADCTTKRKKGAPGGQQQATTQPGGAILGQRSFFNQSKFSARSRPGTSCERKGCAGGRAFIYSHARFFLARWVTRDGLNISTTAVPPVSSMLSQGRQPPETEMPVPA